MICVDIIHESIFSRKMMVEQKDEEFIMYIFNHINKNKWAYYTKLERLF